MIKDKSDTKLVISLVFEKILHENGEHNRLAQSNYINQEREIHRMISAYTKLLYN